MQFPGRQVFMKSLVQIIFKTIDYFFSELLADIYSSARNFSNSLNELFRGTVLGQITSGTGLVKLFGIILFCGNAEDNNFNIRIIMTNFMYNFPSGLTWHINIQQQHINILTGKFCQKFIAITGLVYLHHPNMVSGLFDGLGYHEYGTRKIIILQQYFSD